MCGLFGSISSFLSPGEVDDVLTLGYLSRFRGKDATGIAVVNRRKDKSTKFDGYLRKSTVPAGTFIDDPETIKFLKSIEKPTVLLGHTRAATGGSLTKLNAQPFIHGHIIGAHNGVMDAFRGKDDKEDWSDSNRFYEHLSKEGFESAIKKAQSNHNCAYALTWIDLKTKTLHFVRNKERPLWRMMNKNGLTLLWASDPSFLDFANRRSTQSFDQTVSFAVDTEYRFDLVTRKMSLHDVPKFERKYPVGFGTSKYESGHLGYPDRNWDWESTPPWEKNLDARMDMLKRKKAEKEAAKAVRAGNFRGRNQKLPTDHNIIILDIPKRHEIKDDNTKKYTYFGRDEKAFTLVEIKPHLDTGCYFCSNVSLPQDTVYWRDAQNYLCEDCHRQAVMRVIEDGPTPYNALFHKSRIRASAK